MLLANRDAQLTVALTRNLYRVQSLSLGSLPDV